MNATFRTISALLILQFFSNTAFSQNTTITGHLSGIEEGQYIYLTSYPVGKETLYRDSAKMKKGMFSLQLSIPDGEGSLYYLSSVSMQLTGEAVPVDAINYTHRWKLIYLQEGRVVVNGDAVYLDTATYSGDPYMQEENDYFIKERANVLFEKLKQRVADAYARGENIHASHAVKDNDEDKNMILGAYQHIQLAEAWVTAHPNSPYSASVVYKDISAFFDGAQEEKAKYFHLLTPAARNNKVGKFLANWLH